jgi:hypothetical protein
MRKVYAVEELNASDEDQQQSTKKGAALPLPLSRKIAKFNVP